MIKNSLGKQNMMPAVGPWINYTPDIPQIGGKTEVNFRWRNVRDSIEVEGNLKVGPSLGGAVTFSLPNGLTPVLNGTTNRNYVGHWFAQKGGSDGWGVIFMDGPLYVSNGSSAIWVSSRDLGSSALNNTDNASTFLANGNGLSVKCSVPILEWQNMIFY
jgi:hypothetical protein